MRGHSFKTTQDLKDVCGGTHLEPYVLAFYLKILEF